MAKRQWNRDQLTATLPYYRHALDDGATMEPMGAITLSRETWHNAADALKMMENRQILTVRMRVHLVDLLSEAQRGYIESRVAEELRREALDKGLVLFSKIITSIEADSVVAQAVGIKPFEWRELYT